MTTLDTAVTNDLLSEKALNAVAGGLNPQPLPPRWNFTNVFSHFAINQHFVLPSISFLKFR